MICETCHGTGKLRLPPIPTYAGQTGDGYHNIIAWCFWSRCPDYIGGTAYCCDAAGSSSNRAATTETTMPDEKGDPDAE